MVFKRFRVYEWVSLEIKTFLMIKLKTPKELYESKWISLACIFVFANCSVHILKKEEILLVLVRGFIGYCLTLYGFSLEI